MQRRVSVEKGSEQRLQFRRIHRGVEVAGQHRRQAIVGGGDVAQRVGDLFRADRAAALGPVQVGVVDVDPAPVDGEPHRSEAHTSELQSLMRISYAVFCLKKKKQIQTTLTTSSDIITYQQTA